MVTAPERKTRVKTKRLKSSSKLWKNLTNDFNRKAFVFNSLYYVFNGMPGWFCVYAMAPFLLAAAFLLMFSSLGKTLSLILVILAFLAVHIVSGYMANRHIRNKKKTESKINSDAPVEYLAMSKKRFFTLMVLSGGWYIFYWMYKNWYAIKQATSEKMLVIIRSYILPIFYIYPLFKKIEKSDEKYQQASKIFKTCTVLSVVVWLIGGLCDYVNGKMDWSKLSSLDIAILFLINFVLILVFTALILPIQQKINIYTEKEYPEKKLKSKLTWGEYLIVLIGFLFEYALVAFSMYQAEVPVMLNLMKLPQEQQFALGQTIGHAYRNINGYRIVCAESNFELKDYPKEFKASMAEELDGLEQVLMKDNISLEHAFEIFLAPDTQELIHKELYNELKMIALPEDDGVASACQLLDADAADIAQNVADEIRPLYRKNLEPLLKN